MAEKKEPKLTFEAGLERLEQIVKQLEQGDLALEKSLELFEEGMKLSGLCRKQLEEAESKVELLVKKSDGKMAAEPFAPGSSPVGTSSKDKE
jgi:exodeoxyribonuclease VII small subunit